MKTLAANNAHILYIYMYVYIKLAYYFLFFINIFAEITKLDEFIPLRLFENYN